MSGDREIQEIWIDGWKVHVDTALGHLWVGHSGSITWDDLQSIKDQVWGCNARAIEVFPAAAQLVNTRNCRHLWRLGPQDFCPDLLGVDWTDDSLQFRNARAWAEARTDEERGC